jgi:hypothetical protein
MRIRGKYAFGTRYLIVALSLIGVLVVLFTTSRYGVGITPDSVAYISTARNLIAGKDLPEYAHALILKKAEDNPFLIQEVIHMLIDRGIAKVYIDYRGQPFVDWPPLFPTLLAVVGIGGIDPLEAARYINAISFGLIILVSGRWLKKHVKSPALVFLGSFTVLLSEPLLRVSASAMTESLFILLVLLFLFEIGEFSRSGKPLSVVVSAVVVALACLTRYIGVTLLITGLVLLLFRRNASLTRRLIDATAFGLISVLPIAIWIVRNYLVSSTLVGARVSSSYTLVQNLYHIRDTLAAWFLPPGIPPALRSLTIGLLFILATGIPVFIISRKHSGAYEALLQIMPVACFLIIYTSYLVASVTMVALAFQRINDRLLSPIYAPLMLAIFFTINSIRQLYFHEFFSKQVLNYFLLVAVSLCLVYPLLQVVEFVTDSIHEGIDRYSTREWKESELIAYLKDNPLPGKVISNDPHALYILAGIYASSSPRRYRYDGPSPSSKANALLQFKESLPSSRNVYLVWFKTYEGKDYLYSVQDLHSVLQIEELATFSDGAIYLVKK